LLPVELRALDHLSVFAFTLALSAFLTPMALRIAIRRQILDHPSDIKAQSSPVPYLGGLSIVGAFAAAILVASIVRPPHTGFDQLAIILGIGLLLAVVGLLDDLRGLSPYLRIAIEIAAGIAVWATPAGAVIFHNDVLNFIVTVGWILFVTNAMNLLDNMDGLSSGVAAVSAASIFAVAIDNGQFLVASLAAALAGCALGFLRSNFYPARIYMGDAGALFLGFTLAVLTLKLDIAKAHGAIAIVVPVMLLAVPIFDTIVVATSRIIHGRSPIVGGRDHTSHRLVFIGVSVPAAVACNYIAAASAGCFALVLSRLDLATGGILAGWILLVSIALGILLARIPVYETSRRRHLMLQEVIRHEPEPMAGFGTSAEIIEVTSAPVAPDTA
jgi:UDP-GlcNAc:undecaprenyl-phosphate GlcNAc-1-phosphate transferase